MSKQLRAVLNQINEIERLAVERIIPNAYSSAIAQRRKLAPRTSHQGRRDYNKLLGYALEIDEDQIYTRYLRTGELQRAIKSMPNLAWRRPPAVYDNDGIDGAFALAFKKLVKQTALFDYLQRLDKLARMYPYAVLIIGFNDGGRSLRDTVNIDQVKKNKTEPVLYFRARGKRSVRISEIDRDESSRRFGQPLEYEIEKDTLDDETTSGNYDAISASDESGRQLTVNHQRILHVVHEPLESELYGESVAVSVWDLVDDLLKGVSGPIEGNWRGAVAQNLHIKLKDGVDFTDPDTGEVDEVMASDISDKLNDMVNNITSALMSQYIDEIDEIGGEATDPSKTAEVIWRRFALTIGQPYKMFAGTVQGNTSNLQDKFDQGAVVQSYQEHQCEARMLRPLISKLIAYGALQPSNGDVIIGKYNSFVDRYQWPSPIDINPVELAQAARDQSRAALFLAQARQLGINIDENEVRRAAGLEPLDGAMSSNISQNGKTASAPYMRSKKKLSINDESPVEKLGESSVADDIRELLRDGVRSQLSNARIDRIAQAVAAAKKGEEHEAGRVSAAEHIEASLADEIDEDELTSLLYTIGQVSSLDLFEAEHNEESEQASSILVESVAIGLISSLLGKSFPVDAQILDDALAEALELVGIDAESNYTQMLNELDARKFIENGVDVATANALGELVAREYIDSGSTSAATTRAAAQLDELAESRSSTIAAGAVQLIYRSAGIAAGIVTLARYKEWLLTTSKDPRDVHLAQVGYKAAFLDQFPDGSFWSNELYRCKCGIRLLY